MHDLYSTIYISHICFLSCPYFQVVIWYLNINQTRRMLQEHYMSQYPDVYKVALDVSINTFEIM
jgi:hypothetical protein